MKTVKMAFVLLFALPLLLQADPINPSLFPVDAKWAVQIDAQALKASTIQKAVWNVLREQGKADKIVTQMAALKRIIGFNPIEDIASVTLYNDSFTPEDGVMILKCNYDLAAIENLLNLNESHVTSAYGGVTTHKWYDENKKHEIFGAALDGMLVIASHQSKLETALDTLGDADQSLAETVTPAVMANCPQGAFLVLNATGIGDVKLPKNAAMLANLEDLALVIGEKDETLFCQATLTMKSKEAAAQITQVVQGLLAFAQLNADKKPYLAQLANAVKVTPDEVLVVIEWAFPTAQLIEIGKAMAPRPQQSISMK